MFYLLHPIEQTEYLKKFGGEKRKNIAKCLKAKMK